MSKQQMSIRALSEGALMAGLTAILILGSAFLPVVGAVLRMFCGVPVTIVTVRQGAFPGAVSGIAAILLVSLILGPLSGLMIGLQFVLVGWVFGFMFSRRKSAAKVLGSGVIAASIAALIVAGISFGLMGFSLENVQIAAGEMVTEMVALYQDTGMLEQMGLTAVQFQETAAVMMDTMMRLAPALLMVFGALMAVISYFATTWVLKRLKIKIPRIQNFKRWSLPANTVWGLIIVWALWLAEDYIQMPWLMVAAQNLMLVFGALLFLQGVSVSAYWFGYEKMSTGMKVITVIFLVFFFTGFLVACTLIGLGDLLFDFRKLRKKEPEKQDKMKKES